jgi:pyruvate carboxylase
MSGLLKPMAAKVLISELKDNIDIPIHLHTHDTSGNGVATILMAASAGVDVVDAAFNSMSGLTSQPALNSVVAALEHSDRDTGIDPDEIQPISGYWRDVRPVYKNFEPDIKTASAEIYKYEIPGGQYSNLQAQVDSFGLGHRIQEVKDMYKTVNNMLGDIVKVTPSSKAVGDMAIFMVQNDLTPENILEKGKGMDFPDSIVSFFEGMMGQPVGGFPKDLQKLVLKDKKPITGRPGELLEDEDFDHIKKGLKKYFGLKGTPQEIISYAMYPKVYEDYLNSVKKEGDFRNMGSDIFFHGLALGETCEVKLEEGKELVVKFNEMREPDEDGMRELDFEVNGNRRTVRIKDKDVQAAVTSVSTRFAEEDDPNQVGANIPGNIVKVLVAEGDHVKVDEPIAVIEAMKMETNILATAEGDIKEIAVKEGQQVKAGELVAIIEP